MSKNENSKSLLKSGLVLSVMTLASRIMGLVREMTRASFLGTSMYSDAFTTSFMIPNLLRRLFAENSISVAFIPTFKDYLEKSNDENKSDQEKLAARRETQEFLKATFTLISFLTACVVVLGIVVTPFIAQIFCKKPVDASSMDFSLWEMKKEEITILTRIMFPYLMVISIAAFFQGILNGCKIFAPSGFTPVLFNGIVILGTYILSPFTENPARAMSIGVITGGCIQALFQLPFVLKTGWKVGVTSLKNTFSNPGTKRVIALIGPTIIGMAAYQINDLISTALASRAEVGVVSSLQFSLRLQELILGIFAVSIGTVILPDLSGLASKKEWEKFNSMLVQAIKIITLITIPVTFYSLICGNELITLLYRNKRFDEHSVMLTTGEFRYHIAGLFFIAVNRIISPAFYAQGNTKLPTLAGIISMICNMIFAIVLVTPMSGNGIALALSLASAVNTVFLFIFLGKMQSINIKKVTFDTIIYIFRITAFSLIAATPCKFLRPLLLEKFQNYPRLISQGVPIALLAVIFGLIGVVLLVITKDDMAQALKKKIKR
ncbi:murein biosynthesis integral membrane protein MurJ [Treponema sp. C6A8]|uniref:murein biosynthesis integral membrane protein MurJ n=1 Tax=Treponema sp. C6A8 TaxID=1410609 RepID=UPI0004835429|nr:murein biosynthesis integral membrane protein MurJ [Treponema sp. C6A8]